jgi:predicted component of type VI protein secretion system
MNQEDLRNTLLTLHTQLSSAGEIDATTQAMLQAVTSDIQRLLEHGTTETVADESDDSDDSLSERLRNTLIEFEARHPHVGGLLERITDGLSSMGI